MKLIATFFVAGLSVGTPVWAQSVAESNGQGSYSQSGRSDTLKQARLEMALAGSGSLQIAGTNVPAYTFQVRWTAAGADSVHLSVTSALGDSSATGSGTATLREGRLVSVQLAGATRGGRYTVSFAAGPEPTPTPNVNPRGFSLDQNLGGGGQVKGARGPAERIDKAHVILEKDGNASITLRGARTNTLKGRWKPAGRDTYEVELASGFGSDETRGTAKVYVSRGQLAVIEAEGTSPGMGGSFRLRLDGGR
jgi:hypothetical protein